MNVLITSGETALARALAAALSGEHEVVLTDVVEVETDRDFVTCELGHEGETEALVDGMDAIVHLAELPEALKSDAREMDFQTRCTYNLMYAAREKNVPHVVYVSSLHLFASCDPNYQVTEVWAPRPSTEAGPLARYLGEFTCREFAREHSVRVTCLRFGDVDGDGTMALTVADAVKAIGRVLATDGPMWQVLHVQSDVPHARFPIDRAMSVLKL